jgi:hypothetical protein
MYALHDNGRKLFTSPNDCTPIQRFVYVLAKNHHTDDPKDEDPDPRGMKQGSKIHNESRF